MWDAIHTTKLVLPSGFVDPALVPHKISWADVVAKSSLYYKDVLKNYKANVTPSQRLMG